MFPGFKGSQFLDGSGGSVCRPRRHLWEWFSDESVMFGQPEGWFAAAFRFRGGLGIGFEGSWRGRGEDSWGRLWDVPGT